jgi:YebC/PmpR family DNA-binding regulatory protein
MHGFWKFYIMQNMSGHNKWAQIKHKKAITDSRRGKLWTTISRRITVESKKSAGDIASPALRTWIDKGREANMPKETIERAITKGVSSDAAATEAITYEAYGPGGVAIIINTLTDSRNRTAQEIKHLLSLHGVALASVGSAQWAFEKKNDGYVPQTMIKVENIADEEALMKLLDALDENDDVEEVYTNAE